MISNVDKIRMALTHKKMSITALAKKLDKCPKAFTKRLNTDRFTAEELHQVAEALDAKYYSYFEFPDGSII